MTLQLADGRQTFIDFRETRAARRHRDMFLDASGNVMPDLSTRGHLAVAVPGTVAGLEYARAKYGTLPRARLIAPAIRLAERGFVLEQGDVEMLHEATDDFRKDAASAAIFLNRNAAVAKPAPRCGRRDLARTLRNIGERGADGFYRGETAAALVAASRAAAESSPRRISTRTRRASCRPLECDYRGFHIVAAPPPSSGGIVCARCSTSSKVIRWREYGYGSARRRARHHRGHAPRLRRPQPVVRRPGLSSSNPMRQLLDKNYARQIREEHRSAARWRLAARLRLDSRRTKATTPRTIPSPTASATQSP